MKTIFENVIARGDYDLAGLLKKIDGYHIEGRLSDDERDELYEKARTGANPAESVDVLAKIAELERRVKALEESGRLPPTASASTGRSMNSTTPFWRRARALPGVLITPPPQAMTCRVCLLISATA